MKCVAKISHNQDVALAKVNALGKSWAKFRNENKGNVLTSDDYKNLYGIKCILDTLIDVISEGEND